MYARPKAAAPSPSPTFQSVYQEGVGYVWESLRRLGVREADLEDVTHDLFLVVHRKLGEYDATRPLRPWLFAFALRLAAAYRRSGRVRREVIGEAGELPDRAPTAEDRLALVEAHRLLLEALGALDLEQRAVFVLHDVDGIPMPEIAAALGGSVNTHYTRLRLARRRFTAAVRRIQLRRGRP